MMKSLIHEGFFLPGSAELYKGLQTLKFDVFFGEAENDLTVESSLWGNKMLPNCCSAPPSGILRDTRMDI